VLRAPAPTRDSNELTAATSSSEDDSDDDVWDGIAAVCNRNDNNDNILHVVHSHPAVNIGRASRRYGNNSDVTV